MIGEQRGAYLPKGLDIVLIVDYLYVSTKAETRL